MQTTSAPLSHDELFHALERPAPYSVWRIGGAGIAIRTPAMLIYIDPFLALGGGDGWVRQQPSVINRLPSADLILATHEHDDHADPVALTPQAETGEGLFAGSAPCIEIAQKAGFPAERTCTVSAGDSFKHGTFTITALEARDDDAVAPLAFVIHDAESGITLYHGGDSMPSDLFAAAGAAHHIDVCCLSVGGVSEGVQFYLSPEVAVDAAAMLGARTLIPTHWDLWTKNGIPASAWEPLLQTESPQIALLPPGGRWSPTS